LLVLKREIEELVGTDRMDELKQDMAGAVESCDFTKFMAAYVEALEWCFEARLWKKVDQNEVFEHRYKILPRLKSEFDDSCVCEVMK